MLTLSLMFRKMTRVTAIIGLAVAVVSVGVGYELSVNEAPSEPLVLWSQRACRDAFKHLDMKNVVPQRTIEV